MNFKEWYCFIPSFNFLKVFYFTKALSRFDATHTQDSAISISNIFKQIISNGGWGNREPIPIDAKETFGDLKDAIQAKKQNYLRTVDANKLQLFLAKN